MCIFSLNLLTFFFFLLLLLLIQSITTGVQSDNCNIISCVYRGRNRATTLIIMNSNKLSTPDMNPIAKRGHCCDQKQETEYSDPSSDPGSAVTIDNPLYQFYSNWPKRLYEKKYTKHIQHPVCPKSCHVDLLSPVIRKTV